MGNVPIMALPRNTVFNSCKAEIIIFLVLHYQPKKNTSLSAYGDSDTNAIYRNITKYFTLRCSQVVS